MFEFSLPAETVHVPVLLKEVGEAFVSENSDDDCGQENYSDRNISGRRVWIDGTLGGAGHAANLIPHLCEGDLYVGIDRDPMALDRSEERLRSIDRHCQVKLIHASYRDIPKLIESGELEPADRILLDLGLSSDQLADKSRGFSFRDDGNLDLRFDTSQGISAAEYLSRAKENEIADSIYQFGEERFSRRIARAIIQQRAEKPIRTAKELADLIHRVVPGKIHGRVDSATRTFQALRIVVNRELEHLSESLMTLPKCLKPGGRLIVISFHSLEDRLVKHAMRESTLLNVLTKKPILPSDSEIVANPRSRSAKLRIACRKSDTNVSSVPAAGKR